MEESRPAAADVAARVEDVRRAVDALAEIDDRPVEEHLELLEAVHERLGTSLAALDGPDDRPVGPPQDRPDQSRPDPAEETPDDAPPSGPDARGPG